MYIYMETFWQKNVNFPSCTCMHVLFTRERWKYARKHFHFKIAIQSGNIWRCSKRNSVHAVKVHVYFIRCGLWVLPILLWWHPVGSNQIHVYSRCFHHQSKKVSQNTTCNSCFCLNDSETVTKFLCLQLFWVRTFLCKRSLWEAIPHKYLVCMF